MLETAKLRESQEQADRWHTAQLVAAKDAEAARKSEAEAKRREAEAGETARALAHDVLLYHSKWSNHSWEAQAREKALKALSLTHDLNLEQLDAMMANPALLDASAAEAEALSLTPMSSAGGRRSSGVYGGGAGAPRARNMPTPRTSGLR